MDDIKLFAKNQKKKKYPIAVSSHDIGMKFGIEKCVMLVRKSGKRYFTDEMELLNQEKIRPLREKETYK